MKASETRLLEFIRNAWQFIIPIYQRNYSWTSEQCRQLWDDIIRAGSNNKISCYFIGSIIYILDNETYKAPLYVIDGQQRLATIIMLLTALRDSISDGMNIHDSYTKEKISNYFLYNMYESGELKYKLILSDEDKKTLLDIVDGKNPTDPSIAIKECYDNFKIWISKYKDLNNLCKGLEKLLVVAVALKQNQDEPQLIFESMNYTGLKLSQADLIRNFVLMDLLPEKQQNAYKNYWLPMEKAFSQNDAAFNDFIKHYLSLKTGKIPNINKVYYEFKIYAYKEKEEDHTIEDILLDMYNYSVWYCNIALDREKDKILKKIFSDIKELQVGVAYPMLLEWYADYSCSKFGRDDFIKALKMLESYIFRRAVCDLKSNVYRNIFLSFINFVNKEKYLESIMALFQSLKSGSHFPDDDEFKKALSVCNMYNKMQRGRLKYWIGKLENHGRKEFVNINEYTVEHIMPQKKPLSKEWQDELGPNWEQVQDKYLHTIGNLTLTAYNSELGDRPFAKKKEIGFKDSPLHLNIGLCDVDRWDEDAIQKRAKALTEKCIEIWPHPGLSPEILMQNNKKKSKARDNLSYLKNNPTKQFYQDLRRGIMAFTHEGTISEVSQHSRYVNFSIDGATFVAVIPMANRLRLQICMKFAELRDPENRCINMRGRNHWACGEVCVDLKAETDLPYILYLIRQAFDIKRRKNQPQRLPTDKK